MPASLTARLPFREDIMYTLDERNGWMYAKEEITSFCDPISIINWWPTGVRFVDFASHFATPELAREAIGKPLHPTSNTSYQDTRGWTYRLTNGGQTKPDYTETAPIPEPQQRGRKLPVEWRNGAWYKVTARGSVRV